MFKNQLNKKLPTKNNFIFWEKCSIIFGFIFRQDFFLYFSKNSNLLELKLLFHFFNKTATILVVIYNPYFSPLETKLGKAVQLTFVFCSAEI